MCCALFLVIKLKVKHIITAFSQMTCNFKLIPLVKRVLLGLQAQAQMHVKI